MAISLNTTYPGRVIAPSAGYPQGSCKNETVPNSSDDGTPLDELWGNDFEGLKQAIMRSSGQSPTSPGNVPETALASQIMRGIVELSSGRAKNYDESGVADVYVFDVQTDQQQPETLFDGLEASAYIINTNTGASTVDVAGLGAKSIKNNAGADPAAGDLPAGTYLQLRFDQANDWWVIISGLGLTDADKIELKSGRKNVIINGDFDIWQRGTVQNVTGYDSSDRWSYDIVGTTQAVSQQAFALGQTDVPNNPKFFSRNIVASVAAAGNFARQTQRIEYVKTFAGNTVILSFYAKADAAKDIAIEFLQHFGTGGSPSADVNTIGVTTISLTTSWQKFTVSVAIPSITGKTLGSNGDDYLGLNLWFDAGSTFNTRTNTLGQQSGTFDISHIQFEDSPYATNFERRSFGEELALCQRYYEKSYDTDIDPAAISSNGFSITVAAAATAGGASINPDFSVTKREIPTMTLYNPSTGTVGQMRRSASNIAASTGSIGFNRFQGFNSGSSLDGASHQCHWTADAEL